MEIKYREMNSFEKFMKAIKEAEAQGKRIESVSFTPTEYAEFKDTADVELITQEQMNFANRSRIFGVTISVSEPAPVVKPSRSLKK